MNKALLVIDVQKDYFGGGRIELNGSLEAALMIKELIGFFRERSVEVIHIRHISIKPEATFFLPNTSGIEFHESVQPLSNEKIITKNFPNSFRDTELHQYLTKKDIKHLVITGMMTHMCIDTTVRAAFDLGYQCIVAKDGCATKDLNINNKTIASEYVQNSFLAALGGVFCKVLSNNDIYKLFDNPKSN